MARQRSPTSDWPVISKDASTSRSMRRRSGRAARLWRWGRRNPTMAALLLTALALVALASGGGTWLLQQRSQHNRELRSEIGTAVTQAVSLRSGFHFNEARALLEEARQRLE